MIATKVTGCTASVPRNQVSFSVDFSPRNTSNALAASPTPESEPNDEQMPTSAFVRYQGKGQIAKPGFTHNKFVDGQCILADEEHFSFIWLPTQHHVVFRRPTPEQTLSLLRDILSVEDEIEYMREHVERCFDMDMTESLARHHAEAFDDVGTVASNDPFRRIALAKDLEGWESTQAETTRKNVNTKANNEGYWSFLHFEKWKKQIEGLIRPSNVTEFETQQCRQDGEP